MMHKLTLTLLAAASLAAAQLPTPEAVFNKFIEATGGAAAYGDVKSQTARGSLEFKAMGLKAKVQTFIALPGSSITVLDLPGIGEIRSGVFNGTAWELSPMQGPRLLEGLEKDMALRNTRLDAPLRWKELYKDVAVEAEESVEGKRCFRVTATPTSGGKPQLSWYDADSGLLVKSQMTITSPMGEVVMETLMDDYRPAGKFKAPYKLTQKVGPQQLETIMESIEWNTDIPASQFEPPADVQTLLKKK